MFAVGTRVTSRPPHRSVRAQFGHTLYGAFFVKGGAHHFVAPLFVDFFVRPAPRAFFRPDRILAVAVARSEGQGRRLYGAFFVKGGAHHFVAPLFVDFFVRPAPRAFFRPDRILAVAVARSEGQTDFAVALRWFRRGCDPGGHPSPIQQGAAGPAVIRFCGPSGSRQLAQGGNPMTGTSFAEDGVSRRNFVIAAGAAAVLAARLERRLRRRPRRFRVTKSAAWMRWRWPRRSHQATLSDRSDRGSAGTDGEAQPGSHRSGRSRQSHPPAPSPAGCRIDKETTSSDS